MLALLFLAFSTASALSFSCPQPGHWQTRAHVVCNSTEKYVCLWDDLNDEYAEKCKGPRTEQQGHKAVLNQGNFDRKQCREDYFQPFIFDSTGSRGCVFQKSLCVNEGEVLVSNGTRDTDRQCRCDYTRRYTYVFQPKHPCYCIPSQEDCSCYRKQCGTEEMLSQDYNCIPISDVLTNVSTCPPILKWNKKEEDDMKVNVLTGVTTVKLVGTNLAPILTLISTILILILLAVLGLNLEIMSKLPECNHGKDKSYIEIPYEENNISEIIETEKDRFFYIPIMIVGENGAGKTSLLKRLLYEDPRSIETVESTDGINIMMENCRIRISDGKWFFGKMSNTREMMLRKIKSALRNKRRIEPDLFARNASDEIETKSLNKDDREASDLLNKQQESPKDNDIGTSQEDRSLEKHEVQLESSKQHGLNDNQIFKANKEIHKISKRSYTSDEQKKRPIIDDVIFTQQPPITNLTDVITDEVTQALNEFLNEIEKSEASGEIYVECRFWDFAGQKDYYAIHQIFLNPYAIYLLVIDVSKDIKKISSDFTFDSIGEYVDFWLDNIHSYAKLENKDNLLADRIDPPVLVVFTNTDKCNDTICNERYCQMRDLLHNTEKVKHIRNQFYLSNKFSNDESFDKLRSEIFLYGKSLKKYAVKIPLKWIRLERALDAAREADCNVLFFKDVLKLASMCAIDKEKNVDDFLKYQHNVGNIIYFETLTPFVILSHKWLADAFRCIVTVQLSDSIRFDKDWMELERTGKLSEDLIINLFLKVPTLEFNKYRKQILAVMEQFNTLVKPSIALEAGKQEKLPSYYMPCMIKESQSVKDLEKLTNFKPETYVKSPWLCFLFDFLPISYFNHILVYFIQKYPCQEIHGRPAIFQGMGVFYLDSYKRQQLIVCFARNKVAIQIWQLKPYLMAKGSYITMLNDIRGVIENLRRNCKFSSPVRIFAKCPDGDIHSQAGQITKEELEKIQCDTYTCEDNSHGQATHEKEIILDTWFENFIQENLNSELENSGYLKRRDSVIKGYKDEWFVLQEDGYLKYYSQKPAVLNETPKGQIFLLLSDTIIKNDSVSFHLVSAANETFRLRANSYETREKWTQAINDVREKLYSRFFSGSYDDPVRERVQVSDDADDEDAANIGRAVLEKRPTECADGDDQKKTSAETNIASLFQKHKKPFLAVAAIDFGTTYSGCAFSTVDSFKEDPLKTVSIEIDYSNAVSYKTPTVLLLTPEGRFHSFGSRAENYYLDLAQKDEADKWYYFNRFKMQLYEEKVLHSNMPLKDMNGKTMKAHLVYALCIEHMKDKIMERLTAAIYDLQDEDIHWVLTVPAIWNEQARQFMIKAAETAGIQKHNLTLALEPEAAAMYCKYIALEKKKHKEDVAELKAFETNARFMVVDLGGGTIDITVSEVLPTGQLKEIYNATGGPWGGNYINKTIVEKMRDIIGWDVMRKFREEDLDEYLELIRNIEQRKRGIKFNKDFELMISKDLAKKIRIKDEHKKDVKTYSKRLIFSAEMIKKIYCSSLDKMTKHIEYLLAKNETEGVSTILLVGGYAESDFVQRAIREKFESKVRIIIPLDSDMVVLRGAVITGHIQEAVVDRIAKYHYGLALTSVSENRFSFEHKKDDEKSFYPLIKKGQKIKVGDVVAQYEVVVKKQSTWADLEVYTTLEEEPPTKIDKEHFNKVGSIRIKLPRFSNESVLSLTISYDETEFNVVATDKTTGKMFVGNCEFLQEDTNLETAC